MNTTTGGFSCGTCGQWVPYGGTHTCQGAHPQAGQTCPRCGKYTHGPHDCQPSPSG